MTELVNRSGAPIGAAAIDAFAAGLAGGVIRPGDAGYDAARRIWNAAIDRRPGLDRPLPRRRGRGGCGELRPRERPRRLGARRRPQRRRRALCDDGLVIDLSEMRAVIVDPARRAPCACRAGRRSATSTARPMCTGSRCRRASSRAPVSPGSPSAAASAGWCASTASPATTSSPCGSSPPTAPLSTASDDRAPRPLLGAQGRRRQLRRRHRLHLPRAPGLDRPRRPGDLAARQGRATSCASTATSWRGRRRS